MKKQTASSKANLRQLLRVRCHGLQRTANSKLTLPPGGTQNVTSSSAASRSQATSPRRAPTDRQPRERLHHVLAEQRRETISGPAGVSGDAGQSGATIETSKQSQKRGPSFPKRVDLYLNETGYPQSRTAIPGHENQELHSKRREHLAPNPSGAIDDALSGLVDAVAEHSKVSRPPRRSPDGANRRPQGRGGPSYQSREGGGDRSSTSFTQQGGEGGRLPGLRDRQSRFKTQGGPGGNRGGPGGNKAGGPGGARRPGARTGPPKPRRDQFKGPSVPIKIFNPAPETVVTGRSNYTYASSLPNKGDIPKVQMYMHQAQWSAQRKDVEKALAGSNSSAAVLKGDWKSYIAPVFKQVAEAEKKKSKHGIAQRERKEVLQRAALAVASSPTIQLADKLKLAEKVGFTL